VIITAYKGRYKPQNPQKYKGDPTTIYYRSSWERYFMKYCDETPGVIEWSSEEIVIPYISSVDKKQHRYFVDFWVKMKDKDGNITCKLIEIKPYKQTLKPVPGKKTTPKYIKEVKKWIINSNKWEAATNYCKEKNWEFLILTEKQLFK
jgi:hypothetical protein